MNHPQNKLVNTASRNKTQESAVKNKNLYCGSKENVKQKFEEERQQGSIKKKQVHENLLDSENPMLDHEPMEAKSELDGNVEEKNSDNLLLGHQPDNDLIEVSNDKEMIENPLDSDNLLLGHEQNVVVPEIGLKGVTHQLDSDDLLLGHDQKIIVPEISSGAAASKLLNTDPLDHRQDISDIDFKTDIKDWLDMDPFNCNEEPIIENYTKVDAKNCQDSDEQGFSSHPETCILPNALEINELLLVQKSDENVIKEPMSIKADSTVQGDENPGLNTIANSMETNFVEPNAIISDDFVSPEIPSCLLVDMLSLI